MAKGGVGEGGKHQIQRNTKQTNETKRNKIDSVAGEGGRGDQSTYGARKFSRNTKSKLSAGSLAGPKFVTIFNV